MSVTALLANLDADTLHELADALGLPPAPGAPEEGLRRVIADADAASLPALLAALSRDALKALCKQLQLDASGTGKSPYVQALTARFSQEAGSDARTLSIDVLPKQPRLAWQGMDQHEAVVSVPSQVMEIVRPGRARALVDDAAKEEPRSLLDVNVREVGAAARTDDSPNRLIWTNDNLVALRSLLDERDPKTKDYRYRGKVDLVYIDPPFMVNGDFRGDNAITIDLDEEAHIEAKKEPSLVEFIAYRDTWRNGLDSFLIMLRRRLELLKELLAPTGSIYVHLDWHAVHYVKVLMDEMFGYENFQSEIIWKRTSARAGGTAISHIHDTLLCYGIARSPYFEAVTVPYDESYVRSHYQKQDVGGRYRLVPLNAPGERQGLTGQPWRNYLPPKGRHWSHLPAALDDFAERGMIQFPTKGNNPELKQYLDQSSGIEVSSIWTDISLNAQGLERLGYPTQKPVALLERIISASCPPGGLVLDCFMGSGTTCEAAERLGRRWIGIDAGKYATHLARKRLIQLHGQPRDPEKPQYDYKECDTCGNIERKPKKTRTTARYDVKPFTVENMGVYQRAEAWQDFQQNRSVYRDEMVRVFGGEPVDVHPLLHGQKDKAWVHVGPLDGPISSAQGWQIAQAASETDLRAVVILSADFDTLSGGSELVEIKKALGVKLDIKVIPANAIDEVRRRIEAQRNGAKTVIESMAVPAFYSPLSIRLDARTEGRLVHFKLASCEVDIRSFLDSQRPLLPPMGSGKTAAQKKRVADDHAKWELRQKELEAWLEKATSWQHFVDFWSIDWNYGARVGEDGKPIFQTDWQSFRERGAKGGSGSLIFTAQSRYEKPGSYRIAAKVTDVFGNDGIATVTVTVK